jgi:hypothetical protein
VSGSYGGRYKDHKLGRKRRAIAAKRSLSSDVVAAVVTERRMNGHARQQAHNNALASEAAEQRKRDITVVRSNMRDISARHRAQEPWRDIARSYGMSASAIQRAHKEVLRNLSGRSTA